MDRIQSILRTPPLTQLIATSSGTDWQQRFQSPRNSSCVSHRLSAPVKDSISALVDGEASESTYGTLKPALNSSKLPRPTVAHNEPLLGLETAVLLNRLRVTLTEVQKTRPLFAGTIEALIIRLEGVSEQYDIAREHIDLNRQWYALVKNQGRVERDVDSAYFAKAKKFDVEVGKLSRELDELRIEGEKVCKNEEWIRETTCE